MTRPDDGLGRIVDIGDRALRPLEDAMNFIAAIAVLFIMGLGVVQIVMRMRFIFNAPIFGYIDMIELSMPILAVLGISYAQRYGIHIRMDILIERLKGRTLWALETFNSLVTFGIVVLLTRFSWVFFHDAYSSGDSTVDARLLTWPSKLLVPLALGLLALRMLIQFLGSLRLAIDPEREMIGVIRPMDAVGHAREEAKELVGGEQVTEAIAEHLTDDERRGGRK